MEIKGFYIRSVGDPSVGIFPTQWELKECFFFDDDDELESFRNDLKILFETHCTGEPVYVETFEERQKLIDDETKMYQ